MISPTNASVGMKFNDYCNESLSSASSSLSTDVSTMMIKIGLVWLACTFDGRIYSMVVKFCMSSAGRVYSVMFYA